jgi:hypothetical protein
MVVVTNGLVAEYAGRAAKSYHVPGNNADPTGTWDDLQSYGDGTLTAYTYDATSGWVGAGTSGDPYALYSDGVDNYVDLGNLASFNFTSDFSLELWVKFPATPAAYKGVIAKYGTNAGYDLLLSTGGALRWAIRGTSTIDSGDRGSNLVGSAWHHIVVTGASAESNIYTDRSLVANVTGTWTPTTTTSSLRLSTRTTSYLNTSIATARIYNKVLTLTEVQQNYDAGILALASDPPDVVSTGLVAEYVGKYAKNGNAPGNNTDPTSTWDDLTGTYDSTAMTNFSWTTSEGWVGDGSVGSPHRLRLATGSFGDAYVTFNRETVATGAHTWEFWASNATTADVNVFNHGTNTSANFGMNIGGKPLFQLASNIWRYWVDNGQTYDGVLHHYAMTIPGVGAADISNAILYIDGVVQTVSSTYDQDTVSSWTSLRLGYGYRWAINGSISTFRCYDRVLSSSEVAQNYAAGPTAASTQDLSSLIAFGIC